MTATPVATIVAYVLTAVVCVGRLSVIRRIMNRCAEEELAYPFHRPCMSSVCPLPFQPVPGLEQDARRA